MNREILKHKFGGLCAYSGTPLKDDWQVDHLVPRISLNKGQAFRGTANLMPCQRIINHYKRSLSLNEFRTWYLGGLHNRLKILPKNPKVKRSIRHKEYLLEVAEFFDITADKPFSGQFYFETKEAIEVKYRWGKLYYKDKKV